MDIQVTFKVPHHVFEQAQLAAKQTHRPVEEILSEVLTQAYPAVHVHPLRGKMLAEYAAYERQLGELLARYEGQYVAMDGGKVVDHDTDKLKLAIRIKAANPNTVALIKKVTPEPERELYVRSPRLLR